MELTFYITASLTVLFVLAMIFQNNPVSSAVCLVLSFFSLAGVYITLDAHFIAALQILVYAGAIMVLFVFVIMLLNLKKEELKFDRINRKSLVVFGIAGAFLALMVFLIHKIPTGKEVGFAKVTQGFGTAERVGELLLSDYVVAFEVVGIVLTIGLIGAVMLGRKN